MKRRVAQRVGLLAGMLAAALPAAGAAETIGGYASSYDGDRIDLQGRRIRLAGIDAPERRQTCADAQERLYACGRDAEIALQGKIAGRTVTCEPVPSDQSFPRIALCRLDREDLGAWLVAQGLAVVDPLHAGGYAAQEQEARSARRGLWAGVFTRPSDWRNGMRGKGDGYAMPVGEPAPVAAQAEPARKPDCPIKGNITREGTKLYWLPGSRRYAETVITEATGERWFCTEDEAKAAGWFAPQP